MPSNLTVFLHPLANHSQDSYSAQQLPFKNLSLTSWPLVFLCVELWSMESAPLIQHFLFFLPFCLLPQRCLLPPSLVPSLSCLQRSSSVPFPLESESGHPFSPLPSPCAPALLIPRLVFILVLFCWTRTSLFRPSQGVEGLGKLLSGLADFS